MAEIFIFDIHESYPLISEYMRCKIDCLQLCFTHSIENEENEEEKRSSVEKFYHEYKIKEMKELLNEISQINEGIVWLYHNKYVVRSLKKAQISKPELIDNLNNNLDIIYRW